MSPAYLFTGGQLKPGFTKTGKSYFLKPFGRASVRLNKDCFPKNNSVNMKIWFFRGPVRAHQLRPEIRWEWWLRCLGFHSLTHPRYLQEQSHSSGLQKERGSKWWSW